MDGDTDGDRRTGTRMGMGMQMGTWMQRLQGRAFLSFLVHCTCANHEQKALFVKTLLSN